MKKGLILLVLLALLVACSSVMAADTTWSVTASPAKSGTFTVLANSQAVDPSKIIVQPGVATTITIQDTTLPTSGYYLDSVKKDGIVVDKANLAFTADAKSHKIILYFKKNPVITSSAGPKAGGTITPGKVSVMYGEDQSFTVATATGYYVKSLKVDGKDAQLTNNTYTFSNVVTAHSIGVTFAANPVITASVSPKVGGTITPSAKISVEYGKNQAFILTTSVGYNIKSLKTDGKDAQLTNNTYTFSNVVKAHSIGVTFTVKSYTVTSAVAGGHGKISPLGTKTVNHATALSYTATPDKGYSAEIYIDGVFKTRGSDNKAITYKYENITADSNVEAKFITTPQAPTGVSASSGDGQVMINWDAVSSATSYNIYWSTTAGVTKANGTKITGITSPHSHEELTNGTPYYYVVTAVNSSGESVDSARASAIPTAGSGQISIVSVSSTSPTPLTPLTLVTAGLAKEPVSLTFFNSSGFSFSTAPIRVKADGTVIVAVPLYVDQRTRNVTNGTVSLVLSQGIQTSTAVTLDIQNLPTLDTYGLQPGEISSVFLNFRALLLGRRIGQLQAASLLFDIDTSELQSALSTSLTAVLLARSDVDNIILDPSKVTTYGTLPNGTAIQWDKNSQDMMDRVILVYLLQQFGNVKSSLTKVTAHSPLVTPEAFTLSTVSANLKEIYGVIEESHTLPTLIRDWQKSEDSVDKTIAVLTAGSAFIPASVELLGEKELGGKLGAGFAILDIGRAGIDAFYDLGVFCLDSKSGGDPTAISQDMANLQKSSASLLDAGISALPFGFLFEIVDAGTPDSIPFLGNGLALRDAEMLKTLAGFEDETTSYVASAFSDPYPSPNQGFGQITGTAPPQSSLNLGFFGASALGITGIADSSGNYSMLVPLDVPETDYSALTLSAGDFISGSTWCSETVDLSGLDTSKPIQVPPMQNSLFTFSGTGVMNNTYANSFANCSPDPAIETQTGGPFTVDLVFDVNPFVFGPISGTLYHGSCILTTTTPPLTFTYIDIEGKTQVIICPGTTQEGTIPGGEVPISGHSDGMNITIDKTAPLPGLSGSFTGTVIVEPVTGVVRFSGQDITAGMLQGGQWHATTTYSLTRQ